VTRPGRLVIRGEIVNDLRASRLPLLVSVLPLRLWFLGRLLAALGVVVGAVLRLLRLALPVWQAAQALLAERATIFQANIDNGRPYRLRGLVRCGLCGRRMRGHHSGGRIYYRCRSPRDNRNQLIHPDHPATVNIRQDALLPAV